MVCNLTPPVNGIWGAAGGHRRDVCGWLPFCLLLLFSLAMFSLIDGLLLILLLGLSLIAVGGLVGLLSRFRVLTFWPVPHGCLLLISGRRSKSVEVRNVWAVYDDRHQFISWQDAQRLSESLMMLMMFLVHGLSGLVLLRLRSLMLFGSVAVLFPLGAWFLGEVIRFSELFSLVGLWLRVRGAMLLMLLMVLMCSCNGTLPLIPYWF